MARTRKSLPEALRIVIDDLTFVLKQTKRGYVGEQEIEDLTHCISRIRSVAPVTGTEAELVRQYREAKEAKDKAEDAMSAHFWPLVQAAKTEAEARELLHRAPDAPILKAFMMDHFVYVSKVIPIKEKIA